MEIEDCMIISFIHGHYSWNWRGLPAGSDTVNYVAMLDTVIMSLEVFRALEVIADGLDIFQSINYDRVPNSKQYQ